MARFEGGAVIPEGIEAGTTATEQAASYPLTRNQLPAIKREAVKGVCGPRVARSVAFVLAFDIRKSAG